MSRAIKYYNQRNYPNDLYPSLSNKKATIKTSGCGPTCMAMIMETLTGKTFPPPTAAKYAIKNNARVNGGTNMLKMARAICEDYNLVMTTTSGEGNLLEHLRAGWIAIANVGGDSDTHVGVFSDGGHYIVVGGIASDGRVIVYDPALYAGKFNKAGRKGKVDVKGNACYCTISVLGADTLARTPSYYLFKKKGADDEMIKQTKIKLNGVVKTVDAITKEGNNFIKLQDLRDSKIQIGYDNAAKLPIINSK